MSPLVLFVGAIVAALALIAVHRLFRGARRRFVVASLKPFAVDRRPRLTLARVTAPALLLSRLALLGLLLGLVLAERPEATAGVSLSRGVVAVVPGVTPPPDDGRPRVWLDAALTTVSPSDGGASTNATNTTAAALMALSVRTPAQAPLTVVGSLPASGWPVTMPSFGRDIEWVSAARAAATADDWAAAGGPARIVLLGAPAELERAEAALARIRSTGLLPTDVGWVRNVEPGDRDAVIVADSEWPSTGPWRARLPTVDAVRDGDDVTGVLATRLWHELTRARGRVPVAQADVVPLPTLMRHEDLPESRLDVSDLRAVAPHWLWLVLGLFLLERALAMRAFRRSQGRA